MPLWRVLAILFLAMVCLITAFATVVVPMTEAAADSKWLWMIGLLIATIVMGFLFTLFLKSRDRVMNK